MEEERVVETCPFCGYTTDNDYQMLLHLEHLHAEGESPFVVKDDMSNVAILEYGYGDDAQYASCPIEGCGEDVMFTEVESHIEMHEAESHCGESLDQLASDPALNTQIQDRVRNNTEGISSLSASSNVDPQAAAKAAWKSILRIPTKSSKHAEPSNSNQRRLGKSELGPYANEKQMPSWLVKLLESDGAEIPTSGPDCKGESRAVTVCSNRTYGVIPVLEQLLNQDQATEYAFLCSPTVLHISKLRREGGFCGYRNIQMLTSYIIEAQYPGHECFDGKIPTIFQIQDYIENAWDLGINPQGRIETGGIRGTRKYIGTPDAQAMFCSLGVNCTAQGLKTIKGGASANELLFQAVEQYFIDGCNNFNLKVRRTSLPPVYFQHPGHSLTIVGFEKKLDGSRNVLVFDPMFHDSSNVTSLVGRQFTHKHPADLLKAYRRGSRYLHRYKEFEVLRLSPVSERSNDSPGVDS